MTGSRVRIAAQAKLNLHLRVFAREDSGFHSIETIFHRIDLADDIYIEITSGEKLLDVSGHDAGPAESNLAWRAANAFAEHTGWPAGFRIELTKKIPVGAGLGGGSADAGAVLRALNSMSPNRLGADGLLGLASMLGSDVPFLASDSVMALAWGRGERMLSLPPLSRQDVLLMSPAFKVSTADAYRWLDEYRERNRTEALDKASESIVLDPAALSAWGSLGGFARNDFEGPVAERHPELRLYLQRLRESGAMLAQMTGSGSTIFGILDSQRLDAGVLAEHRELVTTTRTSVAVFQPEPLGTQG
ncbi:MAG: 4-(cytidine 5'-diphospho)-2-C-methyl-D-erythritol kinase [Gemmatimonadota bacterium]|nr:4-(cytidine 5'-diphospho)-2-C-methyl-D-erythritol kinase [Gemmatimonadota bacterium]